MSQNADSNVVLQQIEQLEADIKTLRAFVHGTDTESVLLGGEPTSSLRKMAKDIDERESLAAQATIDEGLISIESKKQELARFAQIAEFWAIAEFSENPQGSAKYWADQVAQGIPDALENMKGKIALATAEEVLAGVDHTKAITPKILSNSLKSKAPSGFGLGEIQARLASNNDLDNAIQGGFYLCDASTVNAPPHRESPILVIPHSGSGSAVRQVQFNTDKVSYHRAKVAVDGIWVFTPWQALPSDISDIAGTASHIAVSQKLLATSLDSLSSANMGSCVIQGREKDGYPAYLIGHSFLNMEHEDGMYFSTTGRVSFSGEYGASYRATKPLRNQIIFQSYGWLTPNGSVRGYWQYEFKQDHILTALFMSSYSKVASLKKWQLLGWNEILEIWETIYQRENDQALDVYNKNLKEYGRMHWFSENEKVYRKIRINIEENHGGSYSSISTLRFYEAMPENKGVHKYDITLAGTEDKPFLASVACGYMNDGTYRAIDSLIIVKKNEVFDGQMFAEGSRNYMYLVPENSEGLLPVNLRLDKALHIPKSKAFLYTDTRKIHYGSIHDIEKECLALMQSQYTVNYNPVPNSYFEQCQGAYPYSLQFTNMKIDTSEKVRGSVSSYRFGGAGNNFVSPDKDLATCFMGKNYVPSNVDYTVEIDFKWEGSDPETSDIYAVLFDYGQYGSSGWILGYHNRKKCFAIYIQGAWKYSVPYNLDINRAWHTISVSRRSSDMYIHIDGKCLGVFNDVPISNPYYKYWMVGRWIHSNSSPWLGAFNNLRITTGTCLYQGEDYLVTSIFNTGLIPDKTLWFDTTERVVKEWDSTHNAWIKTPMLPIGHVDTGRKEHLLTDQPRGTYHTHETKYIESYDASSVVGANYTAKGLFNFGHGGSYSWYCASHLNTLEQWASFKLEKAMAFESLMLCNHAQDWRYTPSVFLWQARNTDQEEWTTLVDCSVYKDDGVGYVPTAPNGNTHHLGSYKAYPYNNGQEFLEYRLLCLDRSDIPFHKDVSYIATRLMLPFRGSKPEILNVSSYVIGDSWEYGSIPLGIATEAIIPVPFGNIPFSVDGYVEEQKDFQSKKRKLGQATAKANSTGASLSHGEIVYSTDDSVIIQTSSTNVSTWNGADNSTSVSLASTFANYNLILKKRGVKCVL